MKKLLFAALAALACGCGQQQESGDYAFLKNGAALGTTWNVTVRMADTTGLRHAIDSLLRGVESSMSVYDSVSLISRLNRNETDSVDAHIAYCLALAERLSRLSDGEYDVTLSPVIAAWGFNAGERQESPDIDSLMQFVGYRKVRVVDGRLVKDDPRVQIDLGSIAKGYAVDLLAALVAARGATDYMAEVGGEIVCHGVNPNGAQWRIGIDKPIDGNLVPDAYRQAVLTVGDGALATSGNYRRFYMDARGGKVVHTVSGRTGMASPTDMLSATVVASECAIADAWATMLMAVGSERARELLSANGEVEAYIIHTAADGTPVVFATAGMDKRISEEEK